MRSPPQSSPFKYSSTRSQVDANKFQSPLLSLKQRNVTNVSSFNDSLINFRKDVNPMQYRTGDHGIFDSGKFNSTEYTSKTQSTKSPRRIQKSFDELPKSSPSKLRKNKGGLHLDEIFNTNKVPEVKTSKSILYGQMKIDSTFRQVSPQSRKYNYDSTYQHHDHHYNPYLKQPAHALQEIKMNQSRERIQRFKSQDSNLDVQLRIQRSSLEKRVLGEKSWLKEFDTLKSSSPLHRNDRIESKVSVNDVMKLTSKLGGITISEVPKLSSSYLSELVSLQDTLGRIIKQSNKGRY